MSEDNLYLLFCYLILGITLLFLTLRSKHKLKTIAINLIIGGLYSGLLFYNLTFNSSGGTGLVWFVFLMFSIGLHWLINFIGLLLTFKKNNYNE
jgi:amino acid transporter